MCPNRASHWLKSTGSGFKILQKDLVFSQTQSNLRMILPIWGSDILSSFCSVVIENVSFTYVVEGFRILPHLTVPSGISG